MQEENQFVSNFVQIFQAQQLIRIQIYNNVHFHSIFNQLCLTLNIITTSLLDESNFIIRRFNIVTFFTYN